MTILTVGIDLAKNVFALHGVNEAGKADLVRPSVPREQLKATLAALPPCVIGMDESPRVPRRPVGLSQTVAA